MVILRFKIRSKPDKRDDLLAALAEIISQARATDARLNLGRQRCRHRLATIRLHPTDRRL